jgi:uncharacterized CHY-type Zn-finger protein
MSLFERWNEQKFLEKEIVICIIVHVFIYFFFSRHVALRIFKMGSENIILCRICHSEFETEEDLSLHTCLQIKQEFQDSNYDVGQNGAQDSKDYELPSNEKVNIDVEKPAPDKTLKKLCICGICSKSFKDNYRLRRHVSQVHTKDGEIIQPDPLYDAKTEIETRDAKKVCICGICNKGFKDNYRLRRHESQVHTKDWNIKQPDQVETDSQNLRIGKISK